VVRLNGQRRRRTPPLAIGAASGWKKEVVAMEVALGLGLIVVGGSGGRSSPASERFGGRGRPNEQGIWAKRPSKEQLFLFSFFEQSAVLCRYTPFHFEKKKKGIKTYQRVF
jgi:hypothetical protein